MFEGDSANMWAGKYPIMPMGADAEGLACADPGLKTPIGVSENLICFHCFTLPVWRVKPSPWTGLHKIICGCKSNINWLRDHTRVFRKSEFSKKD